MHEPAPAPKLTAKPPEVAALASEPPEEATFETIDCPVTAKEAIYELSVGPATGKEAICELSDCPVMVRKTVSEFSACSALVKKPGYEPVVPSNLPLSSFDFYVLFSVFAFFCLSLRSSSEGG